MAASCREVFKLRTSTKTGWQNATKKKDADRLNTISILTTSTEERSTVTYSQVIHRTSFQQKPTESANSEASIHQLLASGRCVNNAIRIKMIDPTIQK